MNSICKIFCAAVFFLAGTAGARAQSVPTHDMYADFGIIFVSNLVSALDCWTQGSNWSADADYAFISCIPLKKRFTNTATQANSELGSDKARLLCWRNPIG